MEYNTLVKTPELRGRLGESSSEAWNHALSARGGLDPELDPGIACFAHDVMKRFGLGQTVFTMKRVEL